MNKRNEGIIVTNGTFTAEQVAVGRNSSATTLHAGAGSNVNLDSHLAGVEQSATGRRGEGADLKELHQTLTELLRAAPGNKQEEAEALAAQASQLVEAATKDKPNRTMLQVLSSGLKQTASFLKDSVPDAFTIAQQIASIVAKIHGISI